MKRSELEQLSASAQMEYYVKWAVFWSKVSMVFALLALAAVALRIVLLLGER